MLIENIYLSNFRNYREESIDFCQGWNLITGKNAQGKTNLLEAVHMGCLGHSHRTRREKEIIYWDQNQAGVGIHGKIKQKKHNQSVEIYKTGSKKSKINGRHTKKVADLIGIFGLVIFSPEDIELIIGDAEKRRRFLDLLLCQLSAEYLKLLRQYKRIITQKRYYLKEQNKYNPELLNVLNQQLAESGAQILFQRNKFVAEFSLIVEEQFKRLNKGRIPLKMMWVSHKWEAVELTQEVEVLQQKFLEKLEEIRDEELLTQKTLIGPHRDNLLFLLKEKTAAKFGSQGQKRLIALSLKLASAEVLKKNSGYAPVHLLDDVFAELDEEKRIILSEVIEKNVQVLVASPRQKDLPFPIEGEIVIHNGAVIR